MKAFVVALVALVAYATALPSPSAPHIDIYKNIVEASSGRVVGGEDAKRNQFPYQASLLWSSSSSGSVGSHICGGTLIARRFVLTAGHCKAYSYGSYHIKLGQLKQNEDHDDVQLFDVVNFVVHEGYPGGGAVAANDIAVIELDRDADLSDAVHIAKLASEDQCNDVSDSVLSGWGRTSAWGGLPINLQWATFPRLTNKQCADALTAILGSSRPLDDSMICIGANEGKQQSACNGDSGGPLVLEKDGYLTGVVSWGISPCGTKGAPSVFTRVCSHLDFINSVVKQ